MSFDEGCQRLRGDARLQRVAAIALPQRIFAVGGCVRDAALGLTTKDLDLVVESDGERIALSAAVEIPARLVRLGGERFAALRLVDEEGWIDLWDLRGGDLEIDLWRRDLTINAIAVDCVDGALHDPTGGRADLGRRMLRATRPGVFLEDPLRVLRLVRFAVTLPGFSVDPATATAARAAAPGIAKVARERVRDELERIFDHPDLSAALSWLTELGLTQQLFGPDAVEPLRHLDRLEPGDRGKSYPPSSPSFMSADGASRSALHWARIASGIRAQPAGAADLLVAFAKSGLLSRVTRETAAALLRPPWSVPADERAARLWLHLAGRTWPQAVALRTAKAATDTARADWINLERWIEALTEAERTAIVEPRLLLDGGELQQLLGIGPGPRVGEELAALRRAQVEGTVVDHAGAERFLAARRDRDRRR